jgi:hypothetical protein
MKNWLVKRRKNLPTLRQREHIRRYSSGKVTKVNPGLNKKPILPRRRPQKLVRDAPKKYEDSVSYKLKPRPTLDIFNLKKVLEGIWVFPKKHIDEWESDLKDELQKVKQKYLSNGISFKEAKDLISELQREFEIMVREEDPIGAVSFNYENSNNPAIIGYYNEDERLEGQGINTYWKSSSGYRGYNELYLSPDSPWEILHEDVALGWSNDEENLIKYDRLLKDYLRKKGIKWAVVSLTTSNVFSSNIYFLVEKGRKKEVESFSERLKKRLRNPEDFDKETNPFYDIVSKSKNLDELHSSIPKDLLKNKAVKNTFDKAVKIVKEERQDGKKR